MEKDLKKKLIGMAIASFGFVAGCGGSNAPAGAEGGGDRGGESGGESA